MNLKKYTPAVKWLDPFSYVEHMKEVEDGEFYSRPEVDTVIADLIDPPNLYLFLRVWNENGIIIVENTDMNLFVPELVMDICKNCRPVFDWYMELIHELLISDPEFFFPEKFEVCQVPVLLECYGHFCASGYVGDDYPDVNFKVHNWTVDFDD